MQWYLLPLDSISVCNVLIWMDGATASNAILNLPVLWWNNTFYHNQGDNNYNSNFTNAKSVFYCCGLFLHFIWSAKGSFMWHIDTEQDVAGRKECQKSSSAGWYEQRVVLGTIQHYLLDIYCYGELSHWHTLVECNFNQSSELNYQSPFILPASSVEKM